jgi:hypothetical protein
MTMIIKHNIGAMGVFFGGVLQWFPGLALSLSLSHLLASGRDVVRDALSPAPFSFSLTLSLSPMPLSHLLQTLILSSLFLSPILLTINIFFFLSISPSLFLYYKVILFDQKSCCNCGSRTLS